MLLQLKECVRKFCECGASWACGLAARRIPAERNTLLSGIPFFSILNSQGGEGMRGSRGAQI